MILDGRYRTGTNTQLRKTKDADLFLRFPQLQELVLGHLASAAFHHCRTLSDDDTLEDGFVARFGEELLSIDSRTDPALERFVEKVRDQIKAQTGTKDKVALASKLIAEACGGTDAESRWSKHFEALHIEPPAVLLIGALLGTAGLCRHRALLLKYILDKLDVCPSHVLDGVVVANGEVDIASLRGRGRGQRGRLQRWSIRPLLLHCVVCKPDHHWPPHPASSPNTTLQKDGRSPVAA